MKLWVRDRSGVLIAEVAVSSDCSFAENSRDPLAFVAGDFTGRSDGRGSCLRIAC
jgi:hypothetical protein